MMKTMEQISNEIKNAGLDAATKENFLPGGKADGEGENVFDKNQLEAGIKHEMEHTENEQVAKEIAMDHLAEDPDYYRKLEKMELSERSVFLKFAAKKQVGIA